MASQSIWSTGSLYIFPTIVDRFVMTVADYEFSQRCGGWGGQHLEYKMDGCHNGKLQTKLHALGSSR